MIKFYPQEWSLCASKVHTRNHAQSNQAGKIKVSFDPAGSNIQHEPIQTVLQSYRSEPNQIPKSW